MKNVTAISMSLIFFAACGGMKQNPVSDLTTLREKGKAEKENPQEGPKVVTKEVIVEKPVEVVRVQSTIDANAIVIQPDRNIRLIEGQPGSFKIRAQVALSGVKSKLVGRNLPEGMTQPEPTKEENIYQINWTAPLGTVPARETMKTVVAKFVLEILETPDEKTRESLAGLARDHEVDVNVLHDQTPPSDLKLALLGDEVLEGTETRFEVMAKVPGIDGKSEQRPQLRISYDGGTVAAGATYLELDGSRHVPPRGLGAAEYLGDSTWKFAVIFDTKNIPVQPELKPDGTPVPNAVVTHVRMNLKVFSPFGSSTPELTKHLVIKRTPVEIPVEQKPVETKPTATGGTQ